MVTFSSTIQRFHASGKLMLTGEYLVLKGALSLAVPLQAGQDMLVEPTSEGILDWKALVQQQPWFEARFSLNDFSVLTCSDQPMCDRLKQILIQMKQMQPDFLLASKGKRVTTNLEFDPNWGWGSSSTLIYNLSMWAGIDAYELNRRIFKGSGYDVACAGADGPLLYQLEGSTPMIQDTVFQPEFADQLYLVWLNKKQNSQKELIRFDLKVDHTNAVDKISNISLSMLQVTNIGVFCELINQHEECMADLLHQPTVREALFPDFPGSLKSLGAWGGDFIMAVPERKDTNVTSYFKQKGFHLVFRYIDIVKDNR
jgi:mevalonate kinase